MITFEHLRQLQDKDNLYKVQPELYEELKGYVKSAGDNAPEEHVRYLIRRRLELCVNHAIQVVTRHDQLFVPPDLPIEKEIVNKLTILFGPIYSCCDEAKISNEKLFRTIADLALDKAVFPDLTKDDAVPWLETSSNYQTFLKLRTLFEELVSSVYT